MKQITFLLLLAFTTFGASQFDRLADNFESGDSVRLYNPLVTTSLSLVPGGGQLYSRHFTRGALFLGTELIVGSQAYTRWQWYRDAKEGKWEQQARHDSLVRSFTPKNRTDSARIVASLHETRLREFNAERSRIEWINWSGWFAGIYAWNLVDGLGCSNRFTGHENPDPKRALLLSAIPFTGAGQFYNGNVFKGAMFSTVQLGCLFSAINFQKVMSMAESYENDLAALPDSAYKLISYDERLAWKGSYDAANRQRTMFMWYGVIFYLYGLADAAVDAHFHDFERHFRISTDLDPTTGAVSFAVNGSFGKRTVSAE